MINHAWCRSKFTTAAFALFALFCALAFASALRGLWHIRPASWLVIVSVSVFCGALMFRFRHVFHRAEKLSNRSMVVLIVIVGLVARIAFVSAVHNDQISDFLIYHELAGSLRNGTGYTYTGPGGFSGDCALFMNRWDQRTPLPTMHRAPGTSLLLAALYAGTGVSTGAAKLFYAVMGALIGLLLFLIVYRTHRTAAFWCAMIWQVYPATIAQSCLVSSEIPFILFFLCALFFMQKGVFDKDRPAITRLLFLLACGLCAGFSCLIRPQQYHVYCMLAMPFLFAVPLRQAAFRSFIVLLAAAIPLAAWSGYNYERFGIFRYQATEVGFSLYELSKYVHPENEYDLDSLKQVLSHSTDELVLDELGRRVAKTRVLRMFTKEYFLYILWQNIHKTWRTDLDGVDCIFKKSVGSVTLGWRTLRLPLDDKQYRWISIVVEVGYIMLWGLVVVANFKRRLLSVLSDPALLVLALNFILTFVALMLFQGVPRYHTTLLPVLMIVAALAIIPSKMSSRNS